jgi:hypothetical protein
MAISVTHKFTSLKGDGADATLIRPSNWNDTHNLNMATSNILGRLSAGPGAVEEIPATAYMLGLLANANYAALAAALGLPTTGDARLTFKAVADAGWVLANDGSIGNAVSGATNRANADTVNLFTFFYNTYNDGSVPVQTSSGSATTRATQGTAAVAYAANCRLVLPRALGRALIVGSAVGAAGAGLTARFPGGFGGEENHLLTSAEVPNHYHAVSISSTGTSSGSGTATTNPTGTDHVHFFSGTFTSTAADRSLDHLHGVNINSGGNNVDHSHNYSQYGGTNAGYQGGGTFAAPFSNIAATTSGASVGHLHNVNGSTGGVDRGIDHLHNVTVSGNTLGMNANHTHSVTVSVSGSASVSGNANTTSAVGYASGGTFGDGAHNNMQPWAGITVMIRL